MFLPKDGLKVAIFISKNKFKIFFSTFFDLSITTLLYNIHFLKKVFKKIFFDSMQCTRCNFSAEIKMRPEQIPVISNCSNFELFQQYNYSILS